MSGQKYYNKLTLPSFQCCFVHLLQSHILFLNFFVGTASSHEGPHVAILSVKAVTTFRELWFEHFMHHTCQGSTSFCTPDYDQEQNQQYSSKHGTQTKPGSHCVCTIETVKKFLPKDKTKGKETLSKRSLQGIETRSSYSQEQCSSCCQATLSPQPVQ